MPVSFAGAKKRKVRHSRIISRMSRTTESQAPAPHSILFSLADELLLAIIDQIDSKKALCNLAATCSRFQGLVEPRIWQTLLVTTGKHARNVAAALDSLESRPSHVHDLSIRYLDENREGIEELNHFISLMERLRHLTIESPCPNNTEWTQTGVFDGATRIDYRALLEASVYPFGGRSPALPVLQSREFPDIRLFDVSSLTLFQSPSTATD